MHTHACHWGTLHKVDKVLARKCWNRTSSCVNTHRKTVWFFHGQGEGPRTGRTEITVKGDGRRIPKHWWGPGRGQVDRAGQKLPMLSSEASHIATFLRKPFSALCYIFSSHHTSFFTSPLSLYDCLWICVICVPFQRTVSRMAFFSTEFPPFSTCLAYTRYSGNSCFLKGYKSWCLLWSLYYTIEPSTTTCEINNIDWSHLTGK